MPGVDLYGWDGTKWVAVLVNTAGKLIIDPSEILEDTPTDGEVAKAPTSNWAHDHADLPHGVPSGVIAMWHGLLANIPSGWVLCDGTNGTPDLRGRFVEGAAAGVDPGTTGGATAKTTAGHYHTLQLQDNNIPVNVSGGYYKGVSDTKTDSIADIRPLYYDVAFIMKT